MDARLILAPSIMAALLLTSCKTVPEGANGKSASFGKDVAFLQKHVKIHLLKSASGAQVALVPAWQGRVMTSSASGANGFSCGWINYPLVKTGIKPEAERTGLESHIYVFGGEERLWLGPEGGQFALFFPPGVKGYTFDKWKTPAFIDTEPFDVKAASDAHIVFEKATIVTNKAGAVFNLHIEREVKILEKADVAKALKVTVPDTVRLVGYESRNVLANTGDKPWTKEGGLLSIWLLGMLKHGPGVTIVVPLAEGAEPAVNSDYFGTPGNDRLRVAKQTVYFMADGQFRSKIGIPPRRARGICGSYDANRGILTVIRYNQPADAASQPYVKSQWKDHELPYAGDVINAYNDGVPEPGAKPLGPFYELESSSPAPPLEPGKAITHSQMTVHFEGTPEQLDPISRATLGVSIAEIKAGLK